jgi:hypothetical protein
MNKQSVCGDDNSFLNREDEVASHTSDGRSPGSGYQQARHSEEEELGQCTGSYGTEQQAVPESIETRQYSHPQDEQVVDQLRMNEHLVCRDSNSFLNREDDVASREPDGISPDTGHQQAHHSEEELSLGTVGLFLAPTAQDKRGLTEKDPVVNGDGDKWSWETASLFVASAAQDKRGLSEKDPVVKGVGDKRGYTEKLRC